MKKIIPFFLVFLFTQFSFAQDRLPAPVAVSTGFMPQGYSINSLNSQGTSNILNSPENISFINPAALSNFENVAVSASYQFETKVKEAWFAEIGGERTNNFVPKSAGAVIPIYGFTLGLSSGQLYNWEIDFGKIEKKTFENPDGTGEFYELEMKTRIYTYSALGSFSLNDIFTSDKLSIGARFNYNSINYFEKIITSEGEVNDNQNNFNIGAVYQYNLSGNKYLQFGLSYSSPIDFSSLIKYKQIDNGGGTIDPLSDNSGNDLIIGLQNEFAFESKVPAKASFDFNLNMWERFQLIGGLNFVNWSIWENAKDQVETFASGIYKLNNDAYFSFGFFTTGRKFKEDILDFNDELSGAYLTAGASYKFKFIKFDLSVANGNFLLSGKAYQNTIGKFGLSFVF